MIKRFSGLLATSLLAVLVMSTPGQAVDPDHELLNMLKDKGMKVQEVKTKVDTITEIDHNFKPYERAAKNTVVLDFKYTSSKEINEKYGEVIATLFNNKRYYKQLTKAEYMKINIWRGEELVAYLVINENNERTFKIIDDQNITSLGMGMTLPLEEYERQLALVERVAQQ